MIYLKLFLTFLKVGAFTFGGGYAMFPLIQEEVLKYNWLSEETLIDFVAVSESTPGPFAVNISTYIGSELGGILGAVCATLGVVIPSFIIILIVAKFFMKFKESKVIKGIMNGLKPCVIGLIGSAVISMALTVFAPDGLKNIVLSSELIISIIIFGICMFLTIKKKHPIVVIFIAAVLGILSGLIFNKDIDTMDYKNNKYIYLEPSKGTFIYSYVSDEYFEVDKIYDVSNDKWNFIYSEGDLFILDKQYKDAIKYYDNDNNYKYKFILDDVGEYSLNVSDKELSYLYDIDNKKRDVSLLFDDIENMGSIIKESKDGVFTGTISLAQYKSNWYYRTEVMNGDKEYMIKLPDTLNNKINEIVGE